MSKTPPFPQMVFQGGIRESNWVWSTKRQNRLGGPFEQFQVRPIRCHPNHYPTTCGNHFHSNLDELVSPGLGMRPSKRIPLSPFPLKSRPVQTRQGFLRGLIRIAFLVRNLNTVLHPNQKVVGQHRHQHPEKVGHEPAIT